VRDVVEALIGLIVSTPDSDDRRSAVRRLRDLCHSGGITLLPRERARLGPDILAEIARV
jgi:hypothetical protein